MKKICGFLLAALVLALTVSFAASAHEIGEKVLVMPRSACAVYSVPQSEPSLFSEKEEALKTKICEALLAMEDSIPFENGDVVADSQTELEKQIEALYYGVTEEHPELYYAREGGYYYYPGYFEEDGKEKIYLDRIEPNYLHEKTELASMLQGFYANAERILALVTDDMSDLEKVLILHDYLVLNCEYDVNYEIYDPYTFLEGHTGVCQAYSYTMRYLLNRLGIESTFCESNPMNHMWNMVKLGGNWYHMDVTWDDPIYDMKGKAMHEYFLMSDAQISDDDLFVEESQLHYAFAPAGLCVDTTYDNAFWAAGQNPLVSDISPICFDDDEYYCMTFDAKKKDASLMAFDKVSGKKRVVKSLGIKWPTDKGYWYGSFSGLAYVNGFLIYNTPTELHAILPDGHHDTVIATFDRDSYEGKPGEDYCSLYQFTLRFDGHAVTQLPFEPNELDPLTVVGYICANPGDTEPDLFTADFTLKESDVHTFEVTDEVFVYPTYVTSGLGVEACEECGKTRTCFLPPLCKSGELPHDPSPVDLVPALSLLAGDPNVTLSPNLFDADGNSEYNLFDLNLIFRRLRAELG